MTLNNDRRENHCIERPHLMQSEQQSAGAAIIDRVDNLVQRRLKERDALG